MKHLKNWFMLLFCVLVLTASIFTTKQQFQKMTVQQKFHAGWIPSGSIIVTMPIAEERPYAQIQQQFERLVSGFERIYPEYEIHFKLYDTPENAPENADICINPAEPFSNSADLTEIYRELDSSQYLCPFEQNQIYLSCQADGETPADVCFVNGDSRNKDIAFLFVEYLLSEYGQMTLYSQSFGDNCDFFPVNVKAFSAMQEQHQNGGIVNET